MQKLEHLPTRVYVQFTEATTQQDAERFIESQDLKPGEWVFGVILEVIVPFGEEQECVEILRRNPIVTVALLDLSFGFQMAPGMLP